jgi:hypothetical protein
VGSVTEEDSLNRKREREGEQEELGMFDVLTKKRKLDYEEIQEGEQEEELLER